ncbi:MAG: NUDIX domain-containing protein [bacterium]|nr:NUDIX domain-containing protein [bacterium]
MEKIRIKKVVCYVTQGEKLLVFRHVDYSYEEVGIQVPAGTIKEGEMPEDAALREVAEETGLHDFASVTFLGTQEYDLTPYRPEVQERHYFHLEFSGSTPERWLTEETHDGLGSATQLECFWINLKSAHILQSGQGAVLYKLYP